MAALPVPLSGKPKEAGERDRKPKRVRGRPLEDSPETWVDIWALCRREHGLTWVEFQDITLAQLEALEERRAIELRHARFNAALMTSALYNMNKSPDSPALSPFDFLAGYEQDPEEAEKDKLRRSVKHAVAIAFTQMKHKSPEEIQAEKSKMIERMTKSGVEDPEGLIREVFPDL
jgi:hypothetical protein